MKRIVFLIVFCLSVMMVHAQYAGTTLNASTIAEKIKSLNSSSATKEWTEVRKDIIYYTGTFYLQKFEPKVYKKNKKYLPVIDLNPAMDLNEAQQIILNLVEQFLNKQIEILVEKKCEKPKISGYSSYQLYYISSSGKDCEFQHPFIYSLTISNTNFEMSSYEAFLKIFGIGSQSFEANYGSGKLSVFTNDSIRFKVTKKLGDKYNEEFLKNFESWEKSDNLLSFLGNFCDEVDEKNFAEYTKRWGELLASKKPYLFASIDIRSNLDDGFANKSLSYKCDVEVFVSMSEGGKDIIRKTYDEYIRNLIKKTEKIDKDFFLDYGNSKGQKYESILISALVDLRPEVFPNISIYPKDLLKNVKDKSKLNIIFDSYIKFFESRPTQINKNFVKWSIENGLISSAEDTRIINIIRKAFDKWKKTGATDNVEDIFVEVVREYKLATFKNDIIAFLSHPNYKIRREACYMCKSLQIVEAKPKLKDLMLNDTYKKQKGSYDWNGIFQPDYDIFGRPIYYYPVREAAEDALSVMP